MTFPRENEVGVVGRIEFSPAVEAARQAHLDAAGPLHRIAELEQALRTVTAELVEERAVREACEAQLADRERRIRALREVFRDE